jgi:hypothetical protein
MPVEMRKRGITFRKRKEKRWESGRWKKERIQ